MKWVKEIEHDGDSQQAVGKTIKSFRIREDREDFEFVFDDGSELRVFGKAMHPSFLANVKEHATPLAGAGVDRWVEIHITGEFDNSAASGGCCVSTCSPLASRG